MRRWIVLLALAFTLALVPAVSAQPMKPLRYEVSGGSATGWLGWVGTIDSGDLEGYAGIWVTQVLELRGGETLLDAKNVYFFEVWFIGDGIDYVDGKVTGNVVLAGFDEGVTRVSNGKFCGNGIVTEAYGDWSDLIGRTDHCSGTVNLSNMTFTSTMQIN